MTVKVSILSETDKDNLDIIYQQLEKIRLPTTYQASGGQGHQIRLGANSQKGARHTTFGLTKFQGRTRISKYATLYPHMLELFDKFIEDHMPGFEYTSVYVNKNIKSKPHFDRINVKESLIVGCGDFSGGHTVVEGSHYDIRDNSIIFNASEMLHSSEDWIGTRYSLVFFSI